MRNNPKRRNAGSRFNKTENGVFWLLDHETENAIYYEIYPSRAEHTEADAIEAKRELKEKHSHPTKSTIVVVSWTLLFRGNLI